MDITTIIVLGYFAWAFYAGWKFMTGRSEYLDRREVVPIILKLICSYFVGIFYGALYLIVIILKFLGFMSRV